MKRDESEAAPCSSTEALDISAFPIAARDWPNGTTIMKPTSCVVVMKAAGAMRCIVAVAAEAHEPPEGIEALDSPVALLMRWISQRQPVSKEKIQHTSVGGQLDVALESYCTIPGVWDCSKVTCTVGQTSW